MSTWLPWTDYSGLTLENLAVAADILVQARNGVVTDHRPDTGESSWSVGVRAYERSEVGFIRAQTAHPWLRVVNGEDAGPSMFVFKIGVHPIRFLHGTPEDMPAKYEKPVFPEMAEQQMALALDTTAPKDRMLRMCVETDPQKLTVKRVVLAELNKHTGAVVRDFTIRDFGASTSTAPLVPFAPKGPASEGVKLNAPKAKLKVVAKKKQGDAAD